MLSNKECVHGNHKYDNSIDVNYKRKHVGMHKKTKRNDEKVMLVLKNNTNEKTKKWKRWWKDI